MTLSYRHALCIIVQLPRIEQDSNWWARRDVAKHVRPDDEDGLVGVLVFPSWQEVFGPLEDPRSR